MSLRTDISVNAHDEQSMIPPRYVIDLSLPPQQRYKALAIDYKTQLDGLTSLFNQLLLDLSIPASWLPAINRFSKVLLRKLHDIEQTQELRGIAEVTGIPMYLLVAFNVILDSLMGCTSGAARSREKTAPRSSARMVHFRTLDWGMDPLRKIVVQLDFVQGSSAAPSSVVASSVTYVGFLGVLTGVKPGLSISLNFRAVHNANTRAAQFRFYFHHLLVLLGQRPSIASLLRSYLFDNTENTSQMAKAASCLQEKHTTAAYIIFSDGDRALTIEKDYATARLRSSTSFIAMTNHDVVMDEDSIAPSAAADPSKGGAVRNAAGLAELLEESSDRLHCLERKWNAKVKRAKKRNVEAVHKTHGDAEANLYVTEKELKKWLCDWPTTNETTHYAALLDPRSGQVLWCRAYPQPLIQPH